MLLVNMEHLVENILHNRVVISGCVSDQSHCKKIEENLRSKHIISNTYYCSAHKNTSSCNKKNFFIKLM